MSIDFLQHTAPDHGVRILATGIDEVTELFHSFHPNLHVTPTKDHGLLVEWLKGQEDTGRMPILFVCTGSKKNRSVQLWAVEKPKLFPKEDEPDVLLLLVDFIFHFSLSQEDYDRLHSGRLK